MAKNPQPMTSSTSFIPPYISKIEETGLSFLWLQDLVLKAFYYQGYMTGFKVADEVALPFAGVVDHILEALKREKLIEVRSSSSQLGLGEGSYLYSITGAGIARAREALERSQYAGPAPVPIQYYNEACYRQGRKRLHVTQRMMRQVLIRTGFIRKKLSPPGSCYQLGNFHISSTALRGMVKPVSPEQLETLSHIKTCSFPMLFMWMDR